MKIRTFYTLQDDVYRVTMHTESWSEADRLLITKYGEPQVDLGGTFTSGMLTFTLDNKLVNVASESPFKQSFDYRDSTSAKDMANLWATTIISRLTAAVATLRTTPDTFTNETVTAEI